MTTWSIDLIRIGSSSSGFQYIVDIALNLTIVASGISVFLIGVAFFTS